MDFSKDKYLRTILGNTIQLGHKIGQNTRARCRLPIEIELKSPSVRQRVWRGFLSGRLLCF